MIRLRSLLAATVLFAAADAGAGGLPTGVWSLVELSGQAFGTGRPPTLELTGEDVQGYAGCNRYRGALKRAGGQLKLGPFSSTRMACPDRMELERTFLGMLENDAAAMRVEGDRLIVTDRAGRTVAVFGRMP